MRPQIWQAIAFIIKLYLAVQLCHVVSAYQTSSRMIARRRPLDLQMRANVGLNVQTLLDTNRARMTALASISPDVSEMTILRYCLQFPNQADAEDALKETKTWRNGSGRKIVESAAKAVLDATAAGGWENGKHNFQLFYRDHRF